MPLVRYTIFALKLVVFSVVAFFVGMVGWAAITGIVAGFLDVFGIHLSATMLTGMGPWAGLALTVLVVWRELA